MGKKRKELSHQEIWDDSGLLESWNQSYEEYKLYHSIHARGERVEDVLKAAEEDDAQEQKEDVRYNGNVSVDGVTSQPASTKKLEAPKEGPDLGWSKQILPGNNMLSYEPYAEDNEGSVKATAPPPDQPLPGPTILHSTQDQALKDLMMSWYWAGYYTGLYEGQRQADRQGT